MEQALKFIDKKQELLTSAFQNKAFFKVIDAERVMQMPKSSIYWYLSKMVELGQINRVSKGKYAIHLNYNNDSILNSGVAAKIHGVLQESGFRFYISGIDVLQKHMQHIPDAYPIMLYVDKFSRDEIEDILLQQNITVISAKELTNRSTISNLSRLGAVVLIYATSNFKFSQNGYATIEKAYVDLYFEITRRGYPLSLQELARIYDNLLNKGAIDKTNMVQAAHEHSIRPEFRKIADTDKISAEAFEMANRRKIRR